jgi:hypothetical protein
MNDHPGDMGRVIAARAKLGVGAVYRTVQTAFDRDPLVLLTWVAALAVLLTAGVRGIHTWSLGAGSSMVSWAGVAPGIVLAAMFIAILGWVYWEVRMGNRTLGPYVVALAASVAVIGICTEAFSGLTALLWQEGHIASTGDDPPSLWAAEQYYLWHLADAVPLIELPQTVRWTEPQGFDDRWSGVLLLLFKIMVIIPLVSVAMAGYDVCREVVAGLYKKLARKHHEADDDGASGPQGTTFTRYDVPPASADWAMSPSAAVWLVVVALPTLTLVSYLALRFVIAPSSPAHTWVTARLPGGVHLGDNALDLPSILNAVDGVTAAVVCLTFGAMLGGVAAVFDRAMRGTGGSRAGTLIASVLVLGPAIMAGAAVSMALLHLEWAEATPSIPQDSEVNATIAWFGWHLADVVPVLDLPETLHWNLRFEFVDRWTGVLLLAGKLLLVGLLAGPVALVVRMTIDRARARRPTPPLLGAAGRFRDLLEDLASLIARAEDAAEEEAKEKESVRAHPTPRIHGRGMVNTTRSTLAPTRDSRYTAVAKASRTTPMLDPAMDQLQSLFGPGEVVDAAEAAASCLTERLEMLEDLPWRVFRAHGWDAVASEVRDRRRSFSESLARYDDAVSAALGHATREPVEPIGS